METQGERESWKDTKERNESLKRQKASHFWILAACKGRYWPQHGEDVSRTGRVLATMESGSKLSQRLQQVQIVASHEVLGQTNNGHHQRDLKKVHFFPPFLFKIVIKLGELPKLEHKWQFSSSNDIIAKLKKKKKIILEFQCNIILLLHDGRLTSPPLSQLTEPPSPHACHSSWSNRTAPSSDPVWGLTQKCSFRL